MSHFELLLSFFILYVTSVTSAITPLCLMCQCNAAPNEAPNIKCGYSKVPDIFDNKYWFDNFNRSYPIESLILKFNDLKNITTKFPVSNLTILNLSDNIINNIGDAVFSDLQEMKELILSNNNIHYLNPEAFRGVYNRNEYFPLKSLRVLDLSYNRIHSLNADTFEHVDEMEILILRNNPFKFIDSPTLSAIASLVNLKELDLSYTLLQDLPENFLYTPRHLKILNLSGNDYTTIPKDLEEAHALEELYFDNNPVLYLTSLNTPKISTLKILHLSRMPHLRRICEFSIGKLEGLNELHLSYNEKLNTIDPKAFAVQSYDEEINVTLRKIFINNNNLANLERGTLNIKVIEEMDITGNPWSCDCRNQWLIDDVVQFNLKVDDVGVKQMRCASPIEMKNTSLYELHLQRKRLRCLRFSEKVTGEDIWLLIGITSGILLGVAFMLFLVYVYRIKILHVGNFNYPAYSRVY